MVVDTSALVAILPLRNDLAGERAVGPSSRRRSGML
jgi:hypothetical protein